MGAPYQLSHHIFWTPPEQNLVIRLNDTSVGLSPHHMKDNCLQHSDNDYFYGTGWVSTLLSYSTEMTYRSLKIIILHMYMNKACGWVLQNFRSV